jgi:hypothetical protein
MGDLTQGLTVDSIRPISVAGVTGLTTGFGFDKSAFYTSKMRAHVAADARVTSGALYL